MPAGINMVRILAHWNALYCDKSPESL